MANIRSKFKFKSRFGFLIRAKLFYKQLFSKKVVLMNLDQRLVQSLAPSRVPSFGQLKYIKLYLDKKESRLFFLAVAVFLLSSSFAFWRFYDRHIEILPAFGGSYTEAVVGYPKYVNPLYASINEIDSDLTALVYSSLFKYNDQGLLVGDLADNFSVATDSKTYAVKLRSGILWHNGHSLTAGDVVFTFNAINDQQYKSPLRLSFVGVEASATDDLTVVFKLKEPYGGFINLLTFGILPAELWSNLTPSSVGLTELNLKPIGSGPYRFKSLIKDKNGNLKSFNLEANEDYFLGRPLVKDFSLQFFPSPEEAREALNTGSVDGFGSYASDLGENYETKTFINYYSLATPQVKALFFNTKLGKLSDIKLRQAIAYSLDKKAIVSAAVGKATQYIDGPILPYSQLYSDDFIKYQKDLAVAQKKIEEAGWKLVEVTANDLAKADELLASTDDKKKRAGESYKLLGEGSWYYKNGEYLILKLTTAEIGSNLKLADLVSQSLAEIKVKLVVEPVPANHLQGDVIKTRDYEMLLTGEILPADGDPYLYWHSSQSSGDGLNLSNFNDKELDRLIEDGRLTTDQTRRKIDYAKLSKLIADKVPVIYFYALNYSYAHGHQIKNFNGSVVYSASDRFGSIKNWYTETENNFKW